MCFYRDNFCSRSRINIVSASSTLFTNKLKRLKILLLLKVGLMVIYLCVVEESIYRTFLSECTAQQLNTKLTVCVDLRIL